MFTLESLQFLCVRSIYFNDMRRLLDTLLTNKPLLRFVIEKLINFDFNRYKPGDIFALHDCQCHVNQKLELLLAMWPYESMNVSEVLVNNADEYIVDDESQFLLRYNGIGHKRYEIRILSTFFDIIYKNIAHSLRYIDMSHCYIECEFLRQCLEKCDRVVSRIEDTVDAPTSYTLSHYLYNFFGACNRSWKLLQQRDSISGTCEEMPDMPALYALSASLSATGDGSEEKNIRPFMAYPWFNLQDVPFLVLKGQYLTHKVPKYMEYVNNYYGVLQPDFLTHLRGLDILHVSSKMLPKLTGNLCNIESLKLTGSVSRTDTKNSCKFFGSLTSLKRLYLELITFEFAALRTLSHPLTHLSITHNMFIYSRDVVEMCNSTNLHSLVYLNLAYNVIIMNENDLVTLIAKTAKTLKVLRLANLILNSHALDKKMVKAMFMELAKFDKSVDVYIRWGRHKGDDEENLLPILPRGSTLKEGFDSE